MYRYLKSCATRSVRRASPALLVVCLLGANSLQGHPHGHESAAAAAPAPVPVATTNASPIVSGSGAFRYQYIPSKLQLPETVRMRHGHGLVRDTNGDIYFTYEPEVVEPNTRVLVRFAPDGTGATLLGADNSLAYGAPHGLNLQVTKDGGRVLYHANNAATVHKTSLDGQVLWTQKWPSQMGNYKPTDVVVPPGSERVMVADGYGSSMIHVLKAEDGVYAGKSWGGLGRQHSELNCPHGITFDPRKGLLLIADRGNKRLEYFHTNGLYHSTVEQAEIQAPCNADIQGDYVLVPDLNGPVFILDRDNHVISTVEVGRLLGSRGFKHPHDTIWLENGDIAVCTWSPGRLGYFKRLPPESALR